MFFLQELTILMAKIIQYNTIQLYSPCGEIYVSTGIIYFCAEITSSGPKNICHFLSPFEFYLFQSTELLPVVTKISENCVFLQYFL